MRTLCTPCHALVTKRQATARAAERQRRRLHTHDIRGWIAGGGGNSLSGRPSARQQLRRQRRAGGAARAGGSAGGYLSESDDDAQHGGGGRTAAKRQATATDREPAVAAATGREPAVAAATDREPAVVAATDHASPTPVPATGTCEGAVVPGCGSRSKQALWSASLVASSNVICLLDSQSPGAGGQLAGTSSPPAMPAAALGGALTQQVAALQAFCCGSPPIMHAVQVPENPGCSIVPPHPELLQQQKQQQQQQEPSEAISRSSSSEAPTRPACGSSSSSSSGSSGGGGRPAALPATPAALQRRREDDDHGVISGRCTVEQQIPPHTKRRARRTKRGRMCLD